MVDEPISPALGSLLEVAQRDVLPEIAVGIDQDGVDARDGVEQFGHRVVRLDLDGVGIELEAEAIRRSGG